MKESILLVKSRFADVMVPYLIANGYVTEEDQSKVAVIFDGNKSYFEIMTQVIEFNYDVMNPDSNRKTFETLIKQYPKSHFELRPIENGVDGLGLF